MLFRSNATADADDTTGTDDEDGVTQSTLRANQTGTITVRVTNTSGAAAYLNVWADWNLNNTVDAGEQIATNINIATGTSAFDQIINVTPPATTPPGDGIHLQGAGMPRIGDRGHGDTIVHMNIAVPAKLTGEQRDLLEKMKRAFDEVPELSSPGSRRRESKRKKKSGGIFDRLRGAIDGE